MRRIRVSREARGDVTASSAGLPAEQSAAEAESKIETDTHCRDPRLGNKDRTIVSGRRVRSFSLALSDTVSSARINSNQQRLSVRSALDK